MGDWPKRLEGHYIDRELVAMTGEVDYRYHCIKCGLHVEDLDESALKLQPCDSFSQGIGGGA